MSRPILTDTGGHIAGTDDSLAPIPGTGQEHDISAMDNLYSTMVSCGKLYSFGVHVENTGEDAHVHVGLDDTTVASNAILVLGTANRRKYWVPEKSDGSATRKLYFSGDGSASASAQLHLVQLDESGGADESRQIYG